MSNTQDVRILIADPDFSAWVGLEEAGYQVTYVKSGTAALEKGAQRPHHVVLINETLTDLNGRIVCDNLKQFPWRTPPKIILFSRQPNQLLKQHSLGAHPADLYLEGDEAVSTVPAAIGNFILGKNPPSHFIPLFDSPVPQKKRPKEDQWSFGTEAESQAASSSAKAHPDEVLSRELEGAHQALNELHAEMAKAQQTIHVLQTEQDHLRLDRDKARDEIDQYKKEVHRLKDEPARQVKEIERVVEEWKTRWGKERDRSNKLDRQIEETHLAFDRLRSRAKEDIQKLHYREAVLKDQLSKLKHDADQLLKSKDQQILALTKELKDLQFELERRGEKIVMSQERITFWKERAARATKALRSAVTVLEGEEGSIL